MTPRPPLRHLPAVAALFLACGQTSPPPGPILGEVSAPPPPPSFGQPNAAAPASSDAHLPGQGGLIASIAMRTWVYLAPDDESQKIGYLRAGAVVARAERSAGTLGCAGGWYRIEPRGYVCVGNGATLDLDHPVVRATSGHGPRRGEPMPYDYVISRDPPPHLYFKLPSEDEQRSAEGKRRDASILTFGGRVREALGPADAIPEQLVIMPELPKPYGAERGLHYRAHRGRARRASAFGLLATFDWTDRPFGLTTELDVIPLDRTRVAVTSTMRGVTIDQPGAPAFVMQHGTATYAMGDDGKLRKSGTAPYRSGWVLTGRDTGSRRGMVETTAGVWLPGSALRIADLREDPAGHAEQGRKWIDVAIRSQILVAYEGKRPVFATLVSTGRGEMGDPKKTHATVRGTFLIHAKHVSDEMNGDEDTRESFDLHDVPYIQYFHEGYALHGAYWHDDFGRVRSHGCINLAPVDAAWLFDWTDPQVPDGWHGALNPNAGTLIYVHG